MLLILYLYFLLGALRDEGMKASIYSVITNSTSVIDRLERVSSRQAWLIYPDRRELSLPTPAFIITSCINLAVSG